MKKRSTTMINTVKMVALALAMLPLLAPAATKTSLSSGSGVDAARWSKTDGTGTISCNGSLTVHGSGTVFTTQLFGSPAGSLLYVGGVAVGDIYSILNDSTITLSTTSPAAVFSAQPFTHQTVPMPGDNVVIAPGHVVTILAWEGLTIGNMLISAGASLESDCNLFNINGSLTVNGTFIQLPGCRIIMDGNASTIGGSIVPVTIRSLRVKTTTPAAILTLTAPLTITEKLDIENGTIDLNSNTLTVGVDAATPGELLLHTGKYQNVNGPGTMTRWFAAGTVVLPDMKSAFPLTAGDVNRNAWIDGTIISGGTVSMTQTEQSGTTPISVHENSTIYDKRTNLFWSVSSGNGFAANAVHLRLQASLLPGVFGTTGVSMSAASGSAGGTFSAPTSGTASNDYQANRDFVNQAGLSGSYYIAVTAEAPLPVELTSFTAEVKEGTAVLRWNTATETNNFGFNVERQQQETVDGVSVKTWMAIGFVQGHGNTNTAQSYVSIDRTFSQTCAYRLQQVDQDGTFTYSKEITAAAVSAPSVFALSQNYPNPFNPATTIVFTVPATGSATLKIFTVDGAEVATLFNGIAEAGTFNTVQFNAAGLASGLYFSRLENNGKMQIKKMLLTK